MSVSRTHNLSPISVLVNKTKDYAAFIKIRLSSIVVFSAMAGYVLGAEVFSWAEFSWLIIGGFLVTGASNGFNQVLEKDLDALMTRTENRPIPQKRMTSLEGIVVASILGVLGIAMLWNFLNPLSGWLGLWALMLYVVIYTPMKRLSPWAVFVGAIPGAIPPMLGWVAATGEFGLLPGILFGIQFVWQFPHFWAIAWKLDEDYSKAGFKLLPSNGGRDQRSANLTLLTSILMIPVGILPYIYGITGLISMILVSLATFWFIGKSYKLFKTLDDKDASKVMFASFLYLPIVMIVLMLDKV